MPFNPIAAARRLVKPLPELTDSNYEKVDEEEDRRVIDLYRLQLALYFPAHSTLGADTQTEYTNRDSVVNMLLHGHWLATNRVIERMLATLKEDTERHNRNPANERYFRDKWILRLIETHLWDQTQGLQGLTEVGSREHFDELIHKQRNDAKYVVAIADLLLRASSTPLTPASKQLNISEVMQNVADGAMFSLPEIDIRTLSNYWVDMKQTAICLWLILFKRFPIDIVNIDKDDFFEFTLATVKNVDLLKRFFRTHDQLSMLLRDRGFKFFPTFGVTEVDVQPEVYTFEPLSAEEARELDSPKHRVTRSP